MNVLPLASSTLRTRWSVLILTQAVAFIVLCWSSQARAADAEKIVVGRVEQIAISKHADQVVVSLRLSGVSRRLWTPEDRNSNLRTMHRGDHYRVTYHPSTGEITNYEVLK